MSKIFVHAKTMIDGVSDTPKFDQLITCEDGKSQPLNLIIQSMKM